MSWPTADITFTHPDTSAYGWNTDWYYKYEVGSTTSGRYDLTHQNGYELGDTIHDIEFTVSGTTINLNVNPTEGGDNPSKFKIGSASTEYTSATVTAGDVITIMSTVDLATFTVPSNFPVSSGPTVTSITADKVIVPTDTITTNDFYLKKNDSAYANTNISVSLGTFDPADTARFYDYTLTYNGSAWYTRTIDSKSYSDFYYDDSWTSSPNSGRNPNATNNRILNVLATIPSNSTIGSGSNALTTAFSYNYRVMTYTYSTTLFNVATTIEIKFIVDNKIINGSSEIVGAFYESRTANNLVNATFSSTTYVIGAQQTMTYTQYLLGVATTYYVSDWVYVDEPEGDGYTPPVATTSNGGGKPDRYPLIMTNLFNRNRSLYSIGMTHKDTWDLFE